MILVAVSIFSAALSASAESVIWRRPIMKPISFACSQNRNSFSGLIETTITTIEKPVLRIRDVHPRFLIPFFIPDPGSRVNKIPDSASASKNSSIFKPKIVSKLSKI
jgi:hypothetical protein